MSHEVINTQAQTLPAGAVTVQPLSVIEHAIRTGATADQLERLLQLQVSADNHRLEMMREKRRMDEEDRKARAVMDFTLAMTQFKAEPLEIFKRKAVGFINKDGSFTGYKHAELSDVADVVVPALARHGLSHRWDVKQGGGRVTVTCTVTHNAGHCESVTMDAAPDDSGKKNNIQQMASAVTYLQRYTLLALVGLATKSDDDDGASSGDPKADPLEVWSGRAALAQSLEELGRVSKDGAREFKGLGNVDAYRMFAAAVMARGAVLREPPQVDDEFVRAMNAAEGDGK